MTLNTYRLLTVILLPAIGALASAAIGAIAAFALSSFDVIASRQITVITVGFAVLGFVIGTLQAKASLQALPSGRNEKAESGRPDCP